MPPAASPVSSGSDEWLREGPPPATRMPRDFRPFPISRPASPPASPDFRKRYPVSPRRPVTRKVKSALMNLKEDMDNRKSSPMDRTEIYIASLLKDDVVAPIRRARRQVKQRQQLNDSYPLLHKSAKKRKEGRFRVRVEKSSLSSMAYHDRQRQLEHPGKPSAASSLTGDTVLDQIRQWKRQQSAAKRHRMVQEGNRSSHHGNYPHSSSILSLTDMFSCASLDTTSMGCTIPTCSCTAPTCGSDTTLSTSRNGTETKTELLKLRRELHQLRRMATLEENRPLTEPPEEESSLRRQAPPTATPRPKLSKKVHFCAPLVTKIKHRPYTSPEDIEELYFIPEELDEYELDRETVEGDQFECQLECPTKRIVTVDYHNKPVALTDDDLMLSPSDLSALAEWEDEYSHENLLIMGYAQASVE